MTHKPFNLKRIIRGFGIVLLAAIGLLYLALPIGMGVFTVLPGREAVGVYRKASNK